MTPDCVRARTEKKQSIGFEHKMCSMAKAISIDRTSPAALCRRRHIGRLSLFGSVLRPDFRPDSDVDVLVEFEPDQVPGFLALHEIEAELSKLLGGRNVDLITQRSLNRRLRDRVVATAEIQYVAGHDAFGDHDAAI